MECEDDRKWNNVSVNVESLYSTLEIIQQGKKVGSVWDFLLLVYLELSIEMQELNDTLRIDSMKRLLVCMVE